MIARLVFSLAWLLLLVALPSEALASRCDEGVAEAATLREIVADFESWRDRCVVVTGVTDGTMLFDRVEDYYHLGLRAAAGPGSEFSARVGLEGPRLMRRIPLGRFIGITAVGRVEHCQSVYDRAQIYAGEGATIALQGYCRLEQGPVLQLADLRLGRRLHLQRLTGEEARSAHGNLMRVPDRWPQRREAEALAAAFLRALRAGDRAAMATLHLGNFGREGGDADVARVFEAGSPFGEFVRRSGPVQTEIFVRRDRLGIIGRESLGNTICFCRERDCSERWPISEADADNAPERPFACTLLERYPIANRRELALITRRTERALAEPARTAFRRPSESSRR